MNLTVNAATPRQTGLGYLLTALSILLIAVFPYYQARFGLDWGDTPYHILFYNGQRDNVHAFTFFTPWFGRLWGDTFGFSVMSFRVLDVSCQILMHCLPMVLFFKGTEAWESRIRMAAVGMVMAVNVTLNVFGYDSFSMLVFSLIFMSGYGVIFTGSKVHPILLGLLTGLAVAAKFPNILLVFTLMLTIIGAIRFKGGDWREVAGALIGFLVSAAIAYVLLFRIYLYTLTSEIPLNPFSGILETLARTKELAAQRQSVYTVPLLLKNMIRDVAPIFTLTLSIGLIPMAWNLSQGKGSAVLAWSALAAGVGYALIAGDSRMLKTMAIMLPFLLVGKRLVKGVRFGQLLLLAGLLLYFVVIFKTNVWDSPFRRKYHLLVSSASIVLCIGYLTASWKRGERLQALFSAFCVMLAFNMPMGSVTGLWKSSSIFTFAAPVVFLLAYRSSSDGTRTLMISLATLMATLSIVHKTVVSKTFMDGRMWEVTETVNHPLLKGILTTKERKRNLEEMAHLVDSVRAVDRGRMPVITTGVSQMLVYMSGEPETIPFMLYSDQSELVASELSAKLQADTSIRHAMLTYFYPEEPRFNPKENLTIEKLAALGFKEVRSGVNWQLYAR